MFLDFDFTCKVEDGAISRVRHEGWGDAGYWAPEIHRMMPYDAFPADIWSL